MPDVRTGAQRPRLFNAPQGVSSDGADATELAALCGLFLDPWQSWALDCLLQKRADGRWRTKTGLLVVPRQNGKGALDEAWELHRLFLLHVPEVRHTTHLARTAKDGFLKMRARIEGGRLKDRLMPDRSHGIRIANGEWGFTFKTGQKLTYCTRTESSMRGETLADIVVDEAQHLTEDEMGALSFTMGTKPYGQLLLTGSAPLPGRSETMRRLIAKGREGDPSLTYLEWSIDETLEDIDLDDRDLWAQANPGYGIRLLDDEILAERTNNSDEVFARERLGIVDIDGGVFPPGSWDRLFSESSTLTDGVTYGLAVAEDRSWACVAAAGLNGEGFTHVEYGEYRATTTWVVDWLADLASRRPVKVVVRPNSEAGSLIFDLEQRKIDVVRASMADYAGFCGNLVDAVTAKKDVRHSSQAALDVAVSAAKKRRHGDAFVWEQRNPTTDISPLEAVTLAFGYSRRKKPPAKFVSFS